MTNSRHELLWTSIATGDLHDTGEWHPERTERLPAVAAGLAVPAIAEATRRFDGRKATMDELSLAHNRSHLEKLEAFVTGGGGAIDPDTVTSLGSWDTALWAAGSGLAAIDELEQGHASAAFVAIRPPGHHATATRAMGFCLVNNVAVAAVALADRGERVAIIDWDVHHGNGTQDIFWDDPRVLYASIHEHPAYPGTGSASEVGGDRARGTNVNVPLPRGATGDVALAAFDQVIGPIAAAFEPTWVLISAGYDAHRADPLANLEWSAGDYALLTQRVVDLAPQPGRTVVFLEGGYDLAALTSSVTATAAELTGVRHDVEPPTSGGPGRDAVASAATRHIVGLEKP